MISIGLSSCRYPKQVTMAPLCLLEGLISEFHVRKTFLIFWLRFPSLNFFSFSLATISQHFFFLPYVRICKLSTNRSSHSQFNQSIHFCLFLWTSFLEIQTMQAFSEFCSLSLIFCHLFCSISEPKSSMTGITSPKPYTRRQISSWLR